MKHILIPTDFSENAGDALSYAIALIGKSNAHIHILNVIDPDMVPEASTDLLAIRMDSARDNMAALEGYSLEVFGKEDQTNIKISTEVEIGGISYQIKEKAKKYKADMIIMGTQGERHNAIEKFIGTVSTIVLENAPCPVLLIPLQYKFKPIDNVIFSTNLNHSDPYELWRATQLLRPHTVTVRCLYVSDESNEDNPDLERFAKYMVEKSSSIQTIFNIEKSSDIIGTIQEYAENYDAEMIIMHKSKKSFWENIFATKHTKRMASLSKIPLMILEQ